MKFEPMFGAHYIGESRDKAMTGEVDNAKKGEPAFAYGIYTKMNTADTCRDPDNYICTQLDCKSNLEDAVNVANDYIKNHFFKKDTELRKGEGDIVFTALDSCSYPVRIIIEKIFLGLDYHGPLGQVIRAPASMCGIPVTAK